VPIKPLHFREEVRVRKVRINDPDAIARIHRCDEGASNFLDGFEVAWGDKAPSAHERKSLHEWSVAMGEAPTKVLVRLNPATIGPHTPETAPLGENRGATRFTALAIQLLTVRARN
jgi:hypothetical protein